MTSPRPLGRNGLCTFYADESDDKETFVIACICIPTVVVTATGMTVQWDDYHQKTMNWRRELKSKFNVPVKKELKGSKIATGRNNYRGGTDRIYGKHAINLYRFALEQLDYLPEGCVFSVYANRGATLYGYRKLEASLYALFQRMQKHCDAWGVNTMVFFDEGHGEYLKLFRKACRHLPTGSALGAWESGAPSKSVPFAAAVKDANFKNSKNCNFVQIADLIAYATLMKARKEAGRLTEKEIELGVAELHDAIPKRILNLNVSYKQPRDGIVRLK